MQTVHIEREIPASPLDVYEHFTDPELLVAWWPTAAETDPVTDGGYRMHWSEPGVTLRGKYRRVEPGQRLAFTWKWDHEDLPPRMVDVIFKPSMRGCLVRISHDAGSDDEASDYTNGWIHFLARLNQVLSASD